MSDSSELLETDSCITSSSDDDTDVVDVVAPPGVTDHAHEYVDTRAPKLEPLKRKVAGAARDGQRTFTLVDADGNPKTRKDGQIITVSAKTPQAAAIKAFNHEMRTDSVRARLREIFSKTERSKIAYDASSVPIPADLERHLVYLRETLLPQHVTKGLEIVKSDKKVERGAGTLKALIKAGKMDVASMSDTDVLGASRAEFDKCAERYKKQFWKTLKDCDDDRFYFDIMVPIRVRENDKINSYMCKYVRKTRPPMLSVLRPNFTFEAKAIAIKGKNTSTKGIVGGMFKVKRDSSKVASEMASVITCMKNLGKSDQDSIK